VCAHYPPTGRATGADCVGSSGQPRGLHGRLGDCERRRAGAGCIDARGIRDGHGDRGIDGGRERQGAPAASGGRAEPSRAEIWDGGQVKRFECFKNARKVSGWKGMEETKGA
jgi:hypothetical protein